MNKTDSPLVYSCAFWCLFYRFGNSVFSLFCGWPGWLGYRDEIGVCSYGDFQPAQPGSYEDWLLTGLARFPRSRLTSKSFVKPSMCSYERAGWLGCRDLGFSNRDLGKRAGNFAIWTLHPGYREENITMHFRDRTDITELLILFSSIMKLGIVLFDS